MTSAAKLPTIQDIVDTVTGYYSLRLSDLLSKRRHKSIALPRQICMWLARRHTRYSLQEIGGYFGGRDHTTVMHAQRTVDRKRQLVRSRVASAAVTSVLLMIVSWSRYGSRELSELGVRSKSAPTPAGDHK